MEIKDTHWSSMNFEGYTLDIEIQMAWVAVWRGQLWEKMAQWTLVEMKPPISNIPKDCLFSVCSRVWLFCSPMNCSPPGSSIHGISWARLPEWLAISFSSGSFQPKDWTQVSCIGRQIIYHWAMWEVQDTRLKKNLKKKLNIYLSLKADFKYVYLKQVFSSLPLYPGCF